MVTRRTAIARKLRKNATDVEITLGRHISRSQLGAKFRRQFPLGPYVLDFVSLEARINIELDGDQHADNLADIERDKFVQSQGFVVLRFWNNEVRENLEGVITTILQCLPHSPLNQDVAVNDLPHPSPPLQEGREQI
jgi:crossover junction endodeoxyribonuclease RuvC